MAGYQHNGTSPLGLSLPPRLGPYLLTTVLEGLVSKHRDSYRGGRSDRWVKVKNRQHPAFSRVRDQFS